MVLQYESSRQELKELISKGNILKGKLTDIMGYSGTVDIIGGTLGEAVIKNKWASKKSVDDVKRGAREYFKAERQRNEEEIDNLFQRMSSLILQLPVGRHNNELRKKEKDRFCTELQKANSNRSQEFRLRKLILLGNSISLRLEQLDSNQTSTPKGKMIPEGRPLMGTDVLETIFKSILSDEVRICDPYCSSSTLALLEAIPKNVKISLLTMKITEMGKFILSLGRMRSNGHIIKVTIVNSKDFPHDRFIIAGSKGWSIGTSLKDIGNRASNIHEIANVSEVDQVLSLYHKTHVTDRTEV